MPDAADLDERGHKGAIAELAVCGLHSNLAVGLKHLAVVVDLLHFFELQLVDADQGFGVDLAHDLGLAHELNPGCLADPGIGLAHQQQLLVLDKQPLPVLSVDQQLDRGGHDPRVEQVPQLLLRAVPFFFLLRVHEQGFLRHLPPFGLQLLFVVLLSLPLLSVFLLLLLNLLLVLLQSYFALLLLGLLLLLLLFGKLNFFAFPLFDLLVGHLCFFLLLFPDQLHDFGVLL